MSGKNDPRILVVDDDDPIRSLAAKVLSRASFVVDTAKDGVEALEQVAKNDYNVILLDLMMPRMSGFDVVEHFRRNQPDLLARTIVMTAATNVQIERLDGISVYNIIRKPFDIEELRRTALECLKAHQTAGA